MRRTAQGRLLVVKKRAARNAIQMNIWNCARLAKTVPAVLTTIGKESRRNGTDMLSSSEIDRIIKLTRTKKSERRNLQSTQNHRF